MLIVRVGGFSSSVCVCVCVSLFESVNKCAYSFERFVYMLRACFCVGIHQLTNMVRARGKCEVALFDTD